MIRSNRSGVISGATGLCIVPGYKFAIARTAMITNFHQPDSTLLLLVAAFLDDHSGEKLSHLYSHALERGYRFLSYGDACLLSKESTDTPGS